MGLLSDTSGRNKIICGVKKHGTKLSVLAYLCGFVWMALLAHEEFNAKNYFSENQLLPGMVETYFSNTHNFYKVLRELQKTCDTDIENVNVRQKVKDELEKMNIDVYSQKFHIISKGINGTNIYGIYRSPRASGVESIVLNIPNHGGCKSTSGIAMMLALGRYFGMQTYWAKDIIFLLTEHDVYGMKAWLEGYFEDKQSGINSESLEGHGGSIQAALTLDLESESVSYIDISVHGMNGMLPNLDLVHVLVRIANFESVPVKLQFQNDLYIPPQDFKRSFETLLRMMSLQSSGIPTGNHGLFYKYRIEAYTLKGITSNPKVRSGHPVDFEALGRYIEGVFRSINNLLEHVHQSFFMYLLPNTNRYISIGLYMPPLACLLIPLLNCLLQTWIDIFGLADQETNNDYNIKKIVPLSQLADSKIVYRITMSYISSTLLYHAYRNKTDYLSSFSEGYDEDWFLFATCVTNCVLVVLLIRMACGSLQDEKTVLVLQLYTTIHLMTLIVLASIFNFSAAFFLASVFVPVVMVTRHSNRIIVKLVHLLFLLFSMPPVYLFLTSFLMHIKLKDTSINLEILLNNTIQSWTQQMNSIEQYHDIGLWTGNVLFAAVLPLWIVLASAPI